MQRAYSRALKRAYTHTLIQVVAFSAECAAYNEYARAHTQTHNYTQVDVVFAGHVAYTHKHTHRYTHIRHTHTHIRHTHTTKYYTQDIPPKHPPAQPTQQHPPAATFSPFLNPLKSTSLPRQIRSTHQGHPQQLLQSMQTLLRVLFSHPPTP